MINKLISLVFLTFFLLIGHSYSETQFIYPKKKPSVFKEINNSIKQQTENYLPQRKPVIKSEESPKQDIQNKKSKEKEDVQPKEIIVKKKEEKIIIGFVYPKKNLLFIELAELR